jgi:hypothetical protein
VRALLHCRRQLDLDVVERDKSINADAEDVEEGR